MPFAYLSDPSCGALQHAQQFANGIRTILRLRVVAQMRLIGRTRFDECKHPGQASLVGN